MAAVLETHSRDSTHVESPRPLTQGAVVSDLQRDEVRVPAVSGSAPSSPGFRDRVLLLQRELATHGVCVEPVTLFSDGEALSNGAPPLIYGDGRQDRDFGGEVFNVSACGETSILELFETLREVLSSTQQPQLAAARPGEVRRSWGSAEKAHRVLGWPRAGATR